MTREKWFKLPLELRQRWWLETDYDRKPPSTELLMAVEEALTNYEGKDARDDPEKRTNQE